MKAAVRIGERRFELLAFATVESATAWLRRAASRAENLAALRRLLAEQRPGDSVQRLEDEVVLRRVAAMLVAGRAALAEEPLERLSGVDGEEEETPVKVPMAVA